MDLIDHLKLHGCNLNLIPGYEWRRSGDAGFAPVGVMIHHTAGVNSLQLCIDRALVQFLISKNGVIHVISTGRTGHPGKGDLRVLNEA